ncbi:MAG TPA: PEGA domain-containing protein [Chitinivibrionales bacterium]|jgi:hypothetical protein|nr:PEGA domain-containing protein [Chitinivibrionales bacterium]
MKKSAAACVILGVVIASVNAAVAQSGGLSERSLKVAEINRRIDEQASRNRAIAAEAAKLRSDSAAADARAGARIDSLSLLITDLSARAARANAMLAALREQTTSFASTKGSREAERLAASDSMHKAIAAFEPSVAAWKDSVESAKSGLELARTDSADIAKRLLAESARIRDTTAAMEKSATALAAKVDSIAASIRKCGADSAAAARVNSDSIAAARKRLLDLRTYVAAKDSMVKSTTEELNNSKRDSLAAQTENARETVKRDRSMKTLDSLVPALQNEKDRLLRIRESLQLDSAIESLTAQLGDFLNKSYEARSAATGEQAEKAQRLDIDKGKLEDMLRDEAFAAVAAKIPGAIWRDRNARVGTLITAAQKSLDSASAERERIVREGILNGKQQNQINANFSKENKRLSDRLAASWKELINAKPRVAKLEQDTAGALRRFEASRETFRKLHAALLADSSAASLAAGTMRRSCDALKTSGAQRESARRKEMASASLAIAQTAAILQRVQASLNAVLACQQAARDDSVRIYKEKSVFVSQAETVAGGKQAELRRLQDAVDSTESAITAARADSAAALRDKREQVSASAAAIAQRVSEAHKGELVVKDLEHEREIAATPPPVPATPPPAAAPAAPTPSPSLPVQPSVNTQPKQSASQEVAQRQLILLYDMVEKGKNDAARRAFASSRKLLELNLDPEAFQAIKSTIESLEPTQPPAPEKTAPAPAAPAPPPQPQPAPVVSAPPVSGSDVDRKPATVFITSVPPVATVYMDGQLIGKTSTANLNVTTGKHTMQFVKGDKTCTQEMTFTEGQNAAMFVKLPCGQ